MENNENIESKEVVEKNENIESKEVVENNGDSKNNNNNVLVTLVIILFIIVLALSGYIVYDKMFANKEAAPKNTVSDITNTDNSESANSESTIEDSPKTLTESEAEKLGNELWKYAFSASWGSKLAWEEKETNSNICDDHNLSRTKPEYSYIEDRIKSHFTKDFKAEGYGGSTLDDFVHCEMGRGSIQTYMGTTLKVKEIQEDKIVFNAVSEYCDNSFCERSKEVAETKEKDFIIVKENDKWLISFFYLPN